MIDLNFALSRIKTGVRPRAAPATKMMLIITCAMPAIYLLVMVQLSAITYPFWDHLQIVVFLQKLHDGSLSWADLIAPHNELRPLVYRVVYLLNALLTRWDVRSEYTILYITLYSTFLVHLFFLKRTAPTTGTAWLAAAPISIVFFSPVGHNNFWWSFMFQLDVANLLMLVAIVMVAVRPASWAWHLAATLCGWLAAYTLTNGIFLFIAMVIVTQLAQRDARKPSLFSAFWLLNLIVLLVLYLPGIPVSNHRPSIGHLIVFVLAYLGTPLRGLIWYPYHHQFDVPLNVWWPALIGVILIALSLASLWRARKSLALGEPAAIALFLFTIVAGISAVATAWGRAEFDEFGVADANSSRYSIFAAYLLFGLIYFYACSASTAGIRAAATRSSPLLLMSVVAAGLIVAGTSYIRAVRVFNGSYQFNVMLGHAFVLDESAGPQRAAHPPAPGFRQMGQGATYSPARRSLPRYACRRRELLWR